MRIVFHSRGEITTIHLRGDFTFAARGALTAALEEARGSASRVVMLDVEHVPFMDSAALGTLALWSKTLLAEGRRLVLLRPQERVREILTLADLPSMIPICHDETEAVEAANATRTADPR